jgi:hypothetical protein
MKLCRGLKKREKKMMLPDYIQNACDWAEMQNWKVFPTIPNKKCPYIKDPFGRATNNREEIIELFKDFPEAGLGLPTGPSNRITVVDIDRKNGIDGWFNLRILELDIPEAALVHTPSGGFHLYFDTGNLEIPNSVGEVASGVDIRGAGGYVQGPGTVTNSGRYVWDMRFVSPIRKMVKMPTGLMRHCMAAKIDDVYSASHRRSPIREELMDPILEGSRNSTMASRIGYLLKKLDDSLAWQSAQHINQTCCKPSLGHRELESIFRSILKREKRNG